MQRFVLNRFLLLAVLFLSGVTSLIYQILWIREYSLFFGVHVYSVSTVLAAFMGGLALGSYVFGRLADRFSGRVAVILFLIQVLLGVFALAFSGLLGMMSDLFVWFIREYDLSVTAMNLIRPVLGFTLLIIPSSLMGGVIPVASRMFIERPEQTGARVSLIYLVNNFGAVAGCFLSGFVLVALFGTKITFMMAAVVNLFLGMGGLVYAFYWRKGVAKDADRPAEAFQGKSPGLLTHPTREEKIKADGMDDDRDRLPAYSDRVIRLALWVFGIEGFTTLAYEVLWTRMLVEFSFEKTIYFTTMVIMSFILGLALGGLVFRLIESRIKNLFRFLGTIQVLAGLSSLGLFVLFNHLAPGMIRERLVLQSWWQIAIREYGLIMVMLTIPTLFTGMSFPLISKMLTRRLSHVGSKVGLAGMLDTVGSIGGSLVAGFLLMPLLGIHLSFMIIVGINLVLGLVVYNHRQAAMGLAGRWLAVSLPAVLLAVILAFPPYAYFQLRTQYYPGEKLLFYKEGVAATVSVHEQRDSHLALVINGSKTAYANIEDLRVHKMLAYLPYIFKPEAKTANVIGFGTGVTTSTLLHMLSFDEVRIADICPELLESAVIFSAFNRRVIEHPRFDFMVEDGRSYLLRTNRRYDIISSNAIHARLNANLYTRDFYELCLDRMTPGGLMCQWMPTNWLTNEEFRSLIRAFTDVFEDSQIWFGSRGHLLLVGSNQPMEVDYSTLEWLYRQPGVMMDLSSVDIFTPHHFASRLLLTGEALDAYVAGARVNTDDLPIVEFSRETNLIPNPQALFEMAEAAESIAPHIGFSVMVDPDERALILEVIEFENQMIRDYLRRFADAYGR